jgi:hypothetical protein
MPRITAIKSTTTRSILTTNSSPKMEQGHANDDDVSDACSYEFHEARFSIISDQHQYSIYRTS